MTHDTLTINKEKFKLVCNYSFEEKMNNSDDPAVKLSLYILRLNDNHRITWEEFKRSYLSEKVAQYIKNIVNGQRTFYWDPNRQKIEKEINNA